MEIILTCYLIIILLLNIISRFINVTLLDEISFLIFSVLGIANIIHNGKIKRNTIKIISLDIAIIIIRNGIN